MIAWLPLCHASTPAGRTTAWAQTHVGADKSIQRQAEVDRLLIAANNGLASSVYERTCKRAENQAMPWACLAMTGLGQIQK